MRWKRESNIIAERFRKDDIPGLIKKSVYVEENESVLLEKNDRIYRELGPGEVSVQSGDVTGLTVVDKSEKTIEGKVKNAMFSDEAKTDMSIKIGLRIFHSIKFFDNLMLDRRRFSFQDMWDLMLSEVIYKEMLPSLEGKSSNSFHSEASKAKLAEKTKLSAKDIFRRKGILITSLSIDFKLPESREENEDGPIKPDAGHAFEQKQPKSYAEMQSELGKEKEGKLEKRLRELEEAKDITEQKFYKKELSEEAFQKMMNDFEEKIIEIEAILKRKRG